MWSPTRNPTSFSKFVSTASASGWYIENLDAFNTFLNWVCEEDLNLELPDGYSGHKALLEHLDKIVYGLRQSAKNCVTISSISFSIQASVHLRQYLRVNQYFSQQSPIFCRTWPHWQHVHMWESNFYGQRRNSNQVANGGHEDSPVDCGDSTLLHFTVPILYQPTCNDIHFTSTSILFSYDSQIWGVLE